MGICETKIPDNYGVVGYTSFVSSMGKRNSKPAYRRTSLTCKSLGVIENVINNLTNMGV